MSVKRRTNLWIFLIFAISFLQGVSKGKASVPNLSEWSGQFMDLSQSMTVNENEADNNLHSQNSLLSQDNSNSSFSDSLTVSGYFDSAYRNAKFYESEHHSAISQGDSRIEFWMSSGRKSFSWGPYVRFAGLIIDHSEAFENAWLANPGLGFHVYPSSAFNFGEEYSKMAEILAPLRFFAEYNRMDYWGSENAWRPNEQVRAGADYWKNLLLFMQNTLVL